MLNCVWCYKLMSKLLVILLLKLIGNVAISQIRVVSPSRIIYVGEWIIVPLLVLLVWSSRKNSYNSLIIFLQLWTLICWMTWYIANSTNACCWWCGLLRLLCLTECQLPHQSCQLIDSVLHSLLVCIRGLHFIHSSC